MTFWSGEKLKARLRDEQLVLPFDEDLIDCAAYTLSLGGSAYTSGDSDSRKLAFEQGKTPGDVMLSPGGTLTIQAGQFAFLLTEETVRVPDDAVGFISIKATHKFAGLMNVSGFHVDPGWSSPLIFAVFNAGPRELVFTRGQPLFLIFYADLDRHSIKVKDSTRRVFTGIPSDFIQKMAGVVPSLFKLNKVAEETIIQLRKLESTAEYTKLLAALSLGIALALFAKVVLAPGTSALARSTPEIERIEPHSFSDRPQAPVRPDPSPTPSTTTPTTPR
jgi:dCTP deaminase